MDWLYTLYKLWILKEDDEEHRECHPSGWMRWRPYIVAIALFFILIAIIYAVAIIEKR